MHRYLLCDLVKVVPLKLGPRLKSFYWGPMGLALTGLSGLPSVPPVFYRHTWALLGPCSFLYLTRIEGGCAFHFLVPETC